MTNYLEFYNAFFRKNEILVHVVLFTKEYDKTITGFLLIEPVFYQRSPSNRGRTLSVYQISQSSHALKTSNGNKGHDLY